MLRHLFACLVIATAAPAQDYVPSPPTAKTWEAWRTHILPTADELAWEQIPWLASFHAGLIEAGKQDKPLLFYGMNGHPLGCT